MVLKTRKTPKNGLCLLIKISQNDQFERSFEKDGGVIESENLEKSRNLSISLKISRNISNNLESARNVRKAHVQAEFANELFINFRK